MRHTFASLVLVASAATVPMRAQTEPPFPITVPPGYEIVRVAAAPLVNFPMLGGFDDRGRLFIAENAGVNLDEVALAAQKPSRIVMLEDTDGDGVFDRSSVFADKLTFPQGAQWLDGALYVASPPSIWKLEDTDGDGRADKRTEIATGFKFTGNAADVHGPFLHPNGRLYWCHGRKGHEIYQRDGSLVSKGLGARIWSCRPDGSDIQIHAGGGMDNPTVLTFSQEGEIFGSANIFQGSPRSDAIIHWIHGGVYPRADQEPVLAEFRRTGDLLAATAMLGHVAPAGVTLLRNSALGDDFTGNLMLAEFNTHRIMRIPLNRVGATYRGLPEIFASTADPGIHFTGVIEDADGSLLVINTGAWFRRGCPTSGVARTDVLGSIYRIRRTDARRSDDPRGLRITWNGLTAVEKSRLLADARPFVRDRAVAELVRSSADALDALQAALLSADYLARSNAVWALTRIGSPEAQRIARRAIADADFRVREVACQSVFVTVDREAFDAVVKLLADENPAVRREAARALGRLRNPAAIPSLAAAMMTATSDPALTHALIYALIEIDGPAETRRLLDHSAPATRRAGLIALDQMPDGALTPTPVFVALRDGATPLHTAALLIALKHPEWSREAAEFLEFAFAAEGTATLRETGAKLLGPLLATSAVRDWLRSRLSHKPNSPQIETRVVLDAIATSADAWDESWRAFITTRLRDPDEALAAAALRAVAVHRGRDFAAALRDLAHDTSRPAAFRVAALQVAAGEGKVTDVDSFGMLMQPFLTGGTPAARMQAAAVLGSATLDRSQLFALIELVPNAGPVELAQLLGVFQRGPTDPDLAARLLAQLQTTPARFGVTGATLQAAFRRFPEPAPANAALMVSEVMNAAVAQDSRVLELEKITTGGDSERGRVAFFSGAGACVGCHRAGATGANIGPDLSHIGTIRTKRDLIESIAFPSATIARGFETFRIERKTDAPLIGLIPRETGETVFVLTADGTEHAVPRSTISKQEAVTTSLMPPGLDRVLATPVLADVLAFLQSLK